ncbi:SDR family oxidoreductase [Kineococcus gypseus]|uniref:SDR family oxidoreductase n=1 Tax=Kineococcus gypseus TaxID=1637102 RepID=UPI003D7D4711
MSTTHPTGASTTAAPRVAVVTGASGGIGRATAHRLAADGLAVVVHHARGADRAQEVVRAITAAGGRALAAGADVSREQEVAALFDTAEAAFGGVDVVVNAAGTMPLAPVAELDLAELDEVYRVNVRGTVAVSQQAVRRLRPGGALVNVSSSTTRLQQPTYGAYVASKAAVEALTLVLAREVRGRDVTVNTVAPGPTATPLFLEGKDPALVERIAAAAPLGRLGEPADVAEVVSFLAGPARWVHGQVLHVNGGLA